MLHVTAMCHHIHDIYMYVCDAMTCENLSNCNIKALKQVVKPTDTRLHAIGSTLAKLLPLSSRHGQHTVGDVPHLAVGKGLEGSRWFQFPKAGVPALTVVREELHFASHTTAGVCDVLLKR